MNLQPIIDDVRDQLLAAADASGDELATPTARLNAVLDAAIRLALLDAVSTAAAEITLELAPGSVEVRLSGTDPEFAVTPAPDAASGSALDWRRAAPLEPGGLAGDADDSGSARITLRLPEALKARIEANASREGLSINTWVVRTLAAAAGADRTPPPPPVTGQSFTGWVR